MSNRQSIRSAAIALLTVAGMSLGGYTASASANAAPTETFRYDTARTTAVEIALADTAGQPALLSFYSQGPNGLRLLENAFTGAGGDYSGELRLPAHLNAVVLVMRTADRQKTLTLSIFEDSIVYAE
jgi:hypothetical protein